MRKFLSVSGHAGFLKGFLVAGLFVGIVLCFLPVRYEANDDFGLITYLSDQSGFRSGAYHPTLSAGFGRLLSTLYRVQPGVPWYGLIIYSSAFAGMSLMLSVLFRSAKGLSLLLALPLLCLLFLHVFTFASFTSASLMLEFGVLLCLAEWIVRDECPARKARVYGLLLALGFLIGYFLRWRMTLYAIAFGMPALFFVKKRQLSRAAPLLVAVGLVMVGDRAIFHLTSSDEQKAYLEYNHLRAQFHDRVGGKSHGDLTRKALSKTGWAFEDYGFYKSWILYDSRLFNTQTLRTFLEENDPKQGGAFLRKGREGLERQFRMENHYTLALIFGALCILSARFEDLLRLSKWDRIKSVLALGAIGAGILYVMSFRFVPRVFVPLYIYFFGVCFLLSHLGVGVESDGRAGPVRKGIILACAFAFCMLTGWQAVAQGKINNRILQGSNLEKAYIQKVLSVVKDKSPVPDPVLILMNPMTGLGAQYVHPLKEFSDFSDLRIFPSGWSVNSPRYASILKEMGLSDGRAFLKWMINNPKALVVLLTRSDQETWRWKAMWESYFARRIAPGRGTSLVPVYDFRNKGGVGLVFFSMRSSR